MKTSRTRFIRFVALLCMGIAADLIAANAHAQDPCQRDWSQDQSLTVMRQGRKVPLNIEGCWVAGDPSDSAAAGSSTLGSAVIEKMAVFFGPGRVSIASTNRSMRNIDVVRTYSPDSAPTSDDGTPVAYWEGPTLVLHAEQSADNRSYVTERLSLKDPDTIEYALHVAPINDPMASRTYRMRFHREAARDVESGPCSR